MIQTAAAWGGGGKGGVFGAQRVNEKGDKAQCERRRWGGGGGGEGEAG